MKKFPVIILQTSPEGFSFCRKGLMEAGLIESEDFVMCSTLLAVRLLLDRPGGELALLIMGSVNGAVDLADDFAWEVSQNFPLVEIIWFSFDRPLEPPYSRVIPKGGGKSFAFQLAPVIQEFLSE